MLTQYKERPSGLLVPKDKAWLGGRYCVQHFRDGKVIDEEIVDNLVVDQGLTHMLGVEFAQVSQIVQWYFGLYGNNYTPVSTDTAATIPGNAGEISAAYNGSSRPAFTATANNKTAGNSGSAATFTFNASVTAYGAFLISSNGKGSTSGFLMSATAFASPKNVANGDQLALTYSLTASPS